MTITPHMHDVLCGRGKGSYRHQGNVVYRELVNMYKVDYYHISTANNITNIY